MCLSGNMDACKKAKQLSVGGAIKLMDMASDKYAPELLEIKFKGAAPVLYEKYLNNVNISRTGGYNDMDGGEYPDLELEKLRMDIGRYQYFSGGSNNTIYYKDIELNKLRDEIDIIRNI